MYARARPRIRDANACGHVKIWTDGAAELGWFRKRSLRVHVDIFGPRVFRKTSAPRGRETGNERGRDLKYGKSGD